MKTPTKGAVLICGASIAGPALAYWLHHYGFTVTVVEKAAALRGGGYPIDVRGTALEVVRRMGILPQLRRNHIDSRRLTFLEDDGTAVASLPPQAMTGGAEDIEVRRGDLADLLYRTVADDVEFVFNDSIAELADDPDCVEVGFRSGRRRRFDLVIGADGLH